MIHFFLLVLLISLVMGCLPKSKKPMKPEVAPAPPPKVEKITEPKNALIMVSDQDIPCFIDDLSLASIREAAEKNLTWLLKMPHEKEFVYGHRTFSTGDVIYSQKLLLELIEESDGAEELTRIIRQNFHVFRSVGKNQGASVLFTAYYEPILRGSLAATEKFKFPIYKKPGDLVDINIGEFRPKYKNEKIFGRCFQGKFIPYYNRKEIDSKGVLYDRNLEIIWLDDPVELFFLHIEGSGMIRFEDETYLRVNYASQNGRTYRSIGKFLINEGLMTREGISMDSIKDFLRHNPDMMETVFNHNESYIFFRIVKTGPLGCLGFPLTPGRSIATDRSCFPSGGMAFIVTERPILDDEGKLIRWEKFSRFVFNQDTGGAITGPGRVDLFFGTGDEMGSQAGYMQNDGELYFLVAKNRRKVR